MTLGAGEFRPPLALTAPGIRRLVTLALFAVLTPSVARAAEPRGPTDLPPPRVSELQMRAPEPQWDVGITLGGGVYESHANYDHGAFRLGLELDSLYLRRREADLGLGWTLSASTFNFADARFALGALGVLEVADPISVEVALRGLALTDGNGASPGFNPELRVGLRSLNLKGHYSHAHLLTLGADFSFPVNASDDRPRAAFYLALRGDVMWLVAPIVALF